MKRIRDHVEYLFRNIPITEQSERMKQEIIANLEDKAADYMALGKSEEDAINKSIVEFGDVEDLKKELNLDPWNGIRNEEEPPVHQPLRAAINPYGHSLRYSLLSASLLIAFLFFVDLADGERLWFFYPAFGLAWWPLSLFSRYMSWREKNNQVNG